MRSPTVTGYRNNSEFTIGFNPRKEATVGFLYGRYADGFMTVADPRNLLNVSPTARGYAALVTHFLRSDASSLPAWDKASGAEVCATS